MSNWWYATSVDVTNGSKQVKVNSSDDIRYLERGSAWLKVVGHEAVETDGAFENAQGEKFIRLVKDWDGGTDTGRRAVAFRTVPDFQGVADKLALNIQRSQEVVDNVISKMGTLLTSTDEAVIIETSEGDVEVVPFARLVQEMESQFADFLEGNQSSLDSATSKVDAFNLEQDLKRRATIYSDFAGNFHRLYNPTTKRIGETELEDNWTVERTSAAWGFDASGRLVEYAPNEPRLVIDPETGEPQGILIEEQRTNLFTHSKGNGSFGNGPVFTANAIVSPTGEMDATLINEVTTGSNRYQHVFSAGELSSGQVITVRWMQKRVNFTGQGWSVNPISLFTFSALVNLELPSEVVKLGGLYNGFDYMEAKVTVVDGSLESILRMYCGGLGFIDSPDVTDPFAFYGIQVEANDNGSSPIITNGTAVTRTADMVPRQLLGEFNSEQGTVILSFSSKPNSLNTAVPFDITDGTTDNRLGVVIYSGGNPRIETRYTGQGSAGGGTVTQVLTANERNSPLKIALTYQNNVLSISVNGKDPISTSEIGNSPILDRISIGTSNLNTSLNMCGPVKSFGYFPFSVSLSKLKELSSL